MAASASTTNAYESILSKLEDIRKNSGKADTIGLLDSEISKFISLDTNLATAIEQAHEYHPVSYTHLTLPTIYSV